MKEPWEVLTPAQKRRYARLQREAPTVVVEDMACPEPFCSGKLALLLGRYGRFYGCTKWYQTKCPGVVSARDTGEPYGKPVPHNSREKKRRREVMGRKPVEVERLSAWDRIAAFVEQEDNCQEPT